MKPTIVLFILLLSCIPTQTNAQETTNDIILNELELEGLRDNSSSSEPNDYVVYGDSLYFAAKTNGLYTNKVLSLNKQNQLKVVVDEEIVNQLGTIPFDFIGQTIFYGTRDGLTAKSLIDGNKTILIPPRNGTISGHIYFFLSFNDELYFMPDSTAIAGPICYWKTNGTIEGTVQTDICREQGVISISDIFVINEKLFVLVRKNGESKLTVRHADGTKVELPQDIAYRNQEFPKYDDGIFFQTSDSLYRTDGTIDGTVKITLESQIAKDLVSEVIQFGDKVVSIFQRKVYVTDESAQTVIQLDLSTGDPEEELYSESPYSLLQLGDTVYFFTRYTNINGSMSTLRLLSSDGTQAGTNFVYSFPFLPDDRVNLLHVEGSKFLFDRYHTTNNADGYQELWVSDGTEKGTNAIAAIPFEEIPEPITEWNFFNNRLYYSAFKQGTGKELWQSDGTPEGTFLSKDIGFTEASGASSFIPDHFAQNAEYFFFIKKFDIKENGQSKRIEELWKTEKSTSITEKVSFLNDNSNRELKLKLGNDGLYVWRYEERSVYQSYDLLFLSFASNEMVSIAESKVSGRCGINFGEIIDNSYFYVLGGDTVETEQSDACQLWVADGVNGTSRQLTSFINFDEFQPGSLRLFILNNELHFQPQYGYVQEGEGQKIFKSDGTVEGTTQVFDSVDYGFEPLEFITDITSVNGNIFLSTIDLSHTAAGHTLWLWDPESLVKVLEVQELNTYSYGKFKGEFIFSLDGLVYANDGDPANTRVLISPEEGHRFEFRFTNIPTDQYLFYATSQGDGRRHLWQSDGTTAGSRLVNTPNGYHDARPFSLLDDDLYLTAKHEETSDFVTYRVDLVTGDIAILFGGEIRNLYSYTLGDRLLMYGSRLSDDPIFLNFRSRALLVAKSLGDDMDNDGELDLSDAFPLHSQEKFDSDFDGLGNNIDTDDDNDGLNDNDDLEPLDPVIWADFDNDGEGDLLDLDDDGDGVSDWFDSYPFDASRSDNTGETENPAPTPIPVPTPAPAPSTDGGSGGTLTLYMLLVVFIFSLGRRKVARKS